VAQQLGLTMTRAATAGTHPAYIAALVASVQEALSQALHSDVARKSAS